MTAEASTTRSPGASGGAPAELVHGFDLSRVCWGYRDLFRRAIEELHRRGDLGPERRRVTAKFFELLEIGDTPGLDHVIKHFLEAMRSNARWLLDLPAVFCNVVDLGRELALEKPHYGIAFFSTLAEGGFGGTPAEVNTLVRQMRRLRQVDTDLVMALMRGYRSLCPRMTGLELERYIEAGLQIYNNRPAAGLKFMEGVLRTSETYVRQITQECRLEDVVHRLQRLVRALTGWEVEVGDLGSLDSDDLLERGSSVVGLYQWLYLPARVSEHDNREKNCRFYLLCSIVAGGMLAEHSFPCVHGHPDYQSAHAIFPEHDLLRLNLFILLEYTRVIRTICRRWPGARGAVRDALKEEFTVRPPATAPDRLFAHLVGHGELPADGVTAELSGIADHASSCFDTAAEIDKLPASDIAATYPGLGIDALRVCHFLPDFLFPVTAAAPPPDSYVADLAARRPPSPASAAEDREQEPEEKAAAQTSTATDTAEEQNEDDSAATVPACYLYDEWNQQQHDYYRDYCAVTETQTEPEAGAELPEEALASARRVSRAFERLRPEETAREKYLDQGETINPDLLLKFLVQRRREPTPKIDFYEKPRVSRRDLAVLILLDCSGSTGEEKDNRKTIDVEKNATIIFGEALRTLDDSFAVCGFNSNGPKACHFLLFKDFDEKWQPTAIRRLLSARPANSTRIGPALRHAGYRLRQRPNKQRLILLVTDGQPMDQAYDPGSGYAQHDVRAACQENRQAGIHTFAISTGENTAADMELMFPRNRFVILPDIGHLQRVLPQIYTRLSLR